MTIKQLYSWLRDQSDYVATMAREFDPDPCNDLEAAEIVEEARRRCAGFGFDDLGEEVRVISARSALPILGKMLTWAGEQRSKADMLTVTEAAAQARVGRRKVLAWINTGLLPATNTGRGNRPYYKIDRAVWAGFLTGRTNTAKPAATRRRKQRQPADVIEFFPEYATPA